MEETAGRGSTLRRIRVQAIQFSGAKPFYRSPEPEVAYTAEDSWICVRKLGQFLIYPLFLASQGRSVLARQLLRDLHNGVQAADFPELTQIEADWRRNHATESPLTFLARLRGLVEGISLPEAKSAWSRYQSERSLTPSTAWSHKRHTFYKLLQDLKPRTLTDLACNRGWHSRLATEHGMSSIAIDVDESCVRHVYAEANRESRHILPVVMDLTDPSPRYGVGSRELPPAADRLRSEMATAFAVEHHLVFGRHGLEFSDVAKCLSPFTSRWLLVEFVPPAPNTNANPWAWRPESVAWYRLDHFVGAFQEEFERVEVVPRDGGGRQIVICEYPKRKSGPCDTASSQ
jgi:hypothetical protein